MMTIDRIKESRKQIRIAIGEVDRAAENDVNIPDSAPRDLHEAEMSLNDAIESLEK